MSDLLRALAFAYRRKGDDVMPGNALRLMLAFDLNWFAPADAKRFVERAVASNALVVEGEDLRLAFPRTAVEVPMGFRPTIAVLEEPFPELPRAAAAPVAPSPPPPQLPTESDALDEEANAERARRGGLLTLEVARLLVQRGKGEDVKPLLADAERALLAKRG